MSNGDDVLDNWENFDDDRLSNQVDQLKKEHSNQSISTDTMPFHHQNTVPLVMMMRSPDEEYGANYTQANKPTVKILRRPTQQNSNDGKLNENRPKQPIKTLQQREQEYAEARLRILGSAKNPEDELELNLAKIVMKSQSSPGTDIPPATSNYCQQARNIPHNNIVSTLPPVVTTSSGVNIMMNATTQPSLTYFTYNNTINNGEMKPQDNMVIRMPRGPDGTSGFNFRR